MTKKNNSNNKVTMYNTASIPKNVKSNQVKIKNKNIVGGQIEDNKKRQKVLKEIQRRNQAAIKTVSKSKNGSSANAVRVPSKTRKIQEERKRKLRERQKLERKLELERQLKIERKRKNQIEEIRRQRKEQKKLIEKQRKEREKQDPNYTIVKDGKVKKIPKSKGNAKLKPIFINTFYIVLICVIFILITIRNTVIVNDNFRIKQSKQSELETIQKVNEQLKVTNESALNLNSIEEQAKRLLGMKKLDNSQKIYISLEKKDYIEAGQEDVIIDTDEKNDNLWYKIKDFFNFTF